MRLCHLRGSISGKTEILRNRPWRTCLLKICGTVLIIMMKSQAIERKINFGHPNACSDLENKDMKPLIRVFQEIPSSSCEPPTNKALIGSRKIRDPTATILVPLDYQAATYCPKFF